jgi:hypothetical protein
MPTPQEQLKQMQDMLQKAADAKARARTEADRNAVFASIGKYIGAAMKPFNDAVQEMKRMVASHERMAGDMHSMQVPAPKVTVDLSSLKVPAPNVTVKPIIDLSSIKMPNEMGVKGWISLMGYDRGLLSNPLPVQLRDASGKPVDLSTGLTRMIGGGWSGGGNHVIVDNLSSISISSSGSSSISLVNADGAYYNSDNPLPVSFAASGTQQVQQVSGAVDSVSIVSNIAALDVKQVSGSIDSVNLMQVLGNPMVVGTGYQDNALRIVQATDAISSVSIVSNIAALDIKQVSGSVDSVSVSGVAMTTNPTAVSDAAAVSFKADKIGRQLARPVQVRELLATAYASITNGTETTLVTAAAGSYLDLIYVMGTNNSDAAVMVDLRAVSGGNIVTSIRIPANATAGISLPVPIPQTDTGNAWTADLPDITGTTVTISALFSKEV